VKSDFLDKSEPLPSSIHECEPIYQGEEHVLGTTNMVYENQEPVYEGEVVLAEQADKTGESSPSVDDKATEHQCEIFFFVIDFCTCVNLFVQCKNYYIWLHT